MAGFNNTYPYTDFHELNLSWVIERIRKLMDQVKDLESWKAQHEEEYQQLKDLYQRTDRFL